MQQVVMMLPSGQMRTAVVTNIRNAMVMNLKEGMPKPSNHQDLYDMMEWWRLNVNAPFTLIHSPYFNDECSANNRLQTYTSEMGAEDARSFGVDLLKSHMGTAIGKFITMNAPPQQNEAARALAMDMKKMVEELPEVVLDEWVARLEDIKLQLAKDKNASKKDTARFRGVIVDCQGGGNGQIVGGISLPLVYAIKGQASKGWKLESECITIMLRSAV